jgi:hypothetical protein
MEPQLDDFRKKLIAFSAREKALVEKAVNRFDTGPEGEARLYQAIGAARTLLALGLDAAAVLAARLFDANIKTQPEREAFKKE